MKFQVEILPMSWNINKCKPASVLIHHRLKEVCIWNMSIYNSVTSKSFITLQLIFCAFFLLSRFKTYIDISHVIATTIAKKVNMMTSTTKNFNNILFMSCSKFIVLYSCRGLNGDNWDALDTILYASVVVSCCKILLPIFIRYFSSRKVRLKLTKWNLSFNILIAFSLRILIFL